MIKIMPDDSEILQMPAKTKRKYTPRKPKQPEPPPIAPPQAPNPNVLAAESRINELIEQRLRLQVEVASKNRDLQYMQIQAKAAQDDLSRLEGEIQYRMSMISQMRGGSGVPVPVPQPYAPSVTTYPGYPPQSAPYAPNAPYPQYPAPFDPRLVPPVGVGAIPAPNHGLYPDLVGGPDGARSESAEQLRMDEIRIRGY